MTASKYSSLVHQALASTPVAALLYKSSAVVVERLARGGGATRWYHLLGEGDLDTLAGMLSPGSLVSFYFDARIKRAPYDETVRRAITAIVAETGDAIVGSVVADGPIIDVEIVGGTRDLEEFTTSIQGNLTVFYGPFPAPDSDGVNCVTVVLPDKDGVLRSHPH